MYKVSNESLSRKTQIKLAIIGLFAVGLGTILGCTPSPGQSAVATDASNSRDSALATAGVEQPLLSSTPIPGQSTPTINDQSDCVYIAYPQPRNAYRAWKALGEPDSLTFYNVAGQDKTNNPVRVNYQTLPWMVDVGDFFCK